jgi:hypothetical protein
MGTAVGPGLLIGVLVVVNLVRIGVALELGAADEGMLAVLEDDFDFITAGGVDVADVGVIDFDNGPERGGVAALGEFLTELIRPLTRDQMLASAEGEHRRPVNAATEQDLDVLEVDGRDFFITGAPAGTGMGLSDLL